MFTIDLVEVLKKTEKEMELEIEQIIKDLQSEVVYSFIDCRCFDCFHVWSFDETIETNPEDTDLVCPDCGGDNIIWNRQTYRI